jgi:hypothetical protein
LYSTLIALMMEAAHTSETSVDIQLRTRQYIPEDSELHIRRENLKSHKCCRVRKRNRYIAIFYNSKYFNNYCLISISRYIRTRSLILLSMCIFIIISTPFPTAFSFFRPLRCSEAIIQLLSRTLQVSCMK